MARICRVWEYTNYDVQARHRTAFVWEDSVSNEIIFQGRSTVTDWHGSMRVGIGLAVLRFDAQMNTRAGAPVLKTTVLFSEWREPQSPDNPGLSYVGLDYRQRRVRIRPLYIYQYQRDSLSWNLHAQYIAGEWVLIPHEEPQEPEELPEWNVLSDYD